MKRKPVFACAPRSSEVAKESQPEVEGINTGKKHDQENGKRSSSRVLTHGDWCPPNLGNS